jgi:hypothetical protein
VKFFLWCLLGILPEKRVEKGEMRLLLVYCQKKELLSLSSLFVVALSLGAQKVASSLPNHPFLFSEQQQERA